MPSFFHGCCRHELAEREATLQLQKAEAVAFAVRGARTELRQLAGAQRAAEAGASAAATVAAQAQQVRVAGLGWCLRLPVHILDVPELPPRASFCPPSLPAAQDKKALQQQLRAGWSPRAGDSVFVPRINKRARVVSVDGAGMLTLQAGLLKITATPEEVRQQQ